MDTLNNSDKNKKDSLEPAGPVYEYLLGTFMVNVYKKGGKISKVEAYKPGETNPLPPEVLDAIIRVLTNMRDIGYDNELQRKIVETNMTMVGVFPTARRILATSMGGYSSRVNTYPTIPWETYN